MRNGGATPSLVLAHGFSPRMTTTQVSSCVARVPLVVLGGTTEPANRMVLCGACYGISASLSFNQNRGCESLPVNGQVLVAVEGLLFI